MIPEGLSARKRPGLLGLNQPHTFGTLAPGKESLGTAMLVVSTLSPLCPL